MVECLASAVGNSLLVDAAVMENAVGRLAGIVLLGLTASASDAFGLQFERLVYRR